MNGFIPRTVLGLSTSLLLLAGCAAYRDVVDPCWPERYDSMARHGLKLQPLYLLQKPFTTSDLVGKVQQALAAPPSLVVD